MELITKSVSQSVSQSIISLNTSVKNSVGTERYCVSRIVCLFLTLFSDIFQNAWYRVEVK
jgi:putative cell wall-binding protein